MRTIKMLIRSALICFFCITMLTSSTYAWFTEIASQPGYDDEGNPCVELHWSDNFEAEPGQWHTTRYNNKNSNTDTLFKVEQGLWEPGYAQIRYIQLDVIDYAQGMTYNIKVDENGLENIGDPNLAQVIEVYFIKNVDGEVNRSDLNSSSYVGTLAELGVGYNAQSEPVVIQGGFSKSQPLRSALVLKMKETANNSYQRKSYNFNLSFKVNQTS